MPNFLRIVSNKHHFVKADCMRFTPMNTVSQSQFKFTYAVSTTLSKTIVPTITLKYVFNMFVFLIEINDFQQHQNSTVDYRGVYSVISELSVSG